MKKVQGLNAQALNGRIDAEVGDPMLAVFSALVRSLFPKDDDGEVARKVHLMVLGYLLKSEVQGPR